MRAVCVCAVVGLASPVVFGETVFSGLGYTFEYFGYEDITLPEFQDRMTDNVWITRGQQRGIFNAAQESGYQGSSTSGPSPVGTMWAYGTTADYDTLSYTTWAQLHEASPLTLIGRDIVVHLVDDDYYIDLKFTGWGSGGQGGRFSYQRSVIPAPGIGAAFGLAGLVIARRRR